eukprot:9022785-Alexandrium_andersonii.AAC.1
MALLPKGGPGLGEGDGPGLSRSPEGSRWLVVVGVCEALNGGLPLRGQRGAPEDQAPRLGP